MRACTCTCRLTKVIIAHSAVNCAAENKVFINL